MLYVAGENIRSGDTVVVASEDGKAYRAGQHVGVLVGNAVEQIREGLRICAKNGEVREDDA